MSRTFHLNLKNNLLFLSPLNRFFPLLQPQTTSLVIPHRWTLSMYRTKKRPSVPANPNPNLPQLRQRSISEYFTSRTLEQSTTSNYNGTINVSHSISAWYYRFLSLCWECSADQWLIAVIRRRWGSWCLSGQTLKTGEHNCYRFMPGKSTPLIWFGERRRQRATIPRPKYQSSTQEQCCSVSHAIPCYWLLDWYDTGQETTASSAWGSRQSFESFGCSYVFPHHLYYAAEGWDIKSISGPFVVIRQRRVPWGWQRLYLVVIIRQRGRLWEGWTINTASYPLVVMRQRGGVPWWWS